MVNLIRQAKLSYPQLTKILIEGKANGDAIFSYLKKDFNELELIKIGSASKEERLMTCLPDISTGKVLLPDSKLYGKAWSVDCAEEITTFPKGKYEDRVDAMTLALNWLGQFGETKMIITNMGAQVPDNAIQHREIFKDPRLPQGEISRASTRSIFTDQEPRPSNRPGSGIF
jgi:predicted phage terminase large subunit-like protein